MNLFIALTYKGEPLSLLLAESKEYAKVAFDGMGIQQNSIEEIDPTSIEELGEKVFFILTSKEQNFGMNKEYRKWRRGK